LRQSALTLSLLTALIVLGGPAAARAAAPHPTRVVILGVDHSAQLVSEKDRPGLLTAFIEKLHPDAICIERAPRQAARNDYYEFTYEQTGIILPYVRAHHMPICPVDWMPPAEDMRLAFGRDLTRLPEIRPARGYQSFMAFHDPKTLKLGFFAFDKPAATAKAMKWAAKANPRMDRDFPRRLYLYRTFLQARRVAAAAHAHPGGTVLLVIGAWHTPEIEQILAHDPAIHIVEPSAIGLPSDRAADAATTDTQRTAILSFNLLGLQSTTGHVNWHWMRTTLAKLKADTPNARQNTLFALRLAQLTGELAPEEAADRYRELAAETPKGTQFLWTGVKDRRRVDSYFDPFGNLSVRQRAELEQARALRAAGEKTASDHVLEKLEGELDPRKRVQLAIYAKRFLTPHKATAHKPG
jgi:hypothetical protein